MFCDSPHMHRHLESAYAFQMPYSDCTRGPYNPLIPTPCDGICRKTNVKEKQKSFKQIFEIWSCTVIVKLVSSDITPPQFQWILLGSLIWQQTQLWEWNRASWWEKVTDPTKINEISIFMSMLVFMAASIKLLLPQPPLWALPLMACKPTSTHGCSSPNHLNSALL